MTAMTKRDLLGAGAAIGLLAAAGTAAAQGSRPSAPPFVTRHSGRFNGRRVDYVATVAETVVNDADGNPAARFVSTAYVRRDAAASRPVVFAFNGGPSSSSATLHMLALGPKRALVAQDLSAPEPAPQRVDNPDAILDVADLVMIDPAETGFSRVLPGADRSYFYSVDGDARSVADFVLQWSRDNGREASPKYVLGESYGSIRATVMAGLLAADSPLAGVFLFGQASNMIETSQRAKNALAYATNLPALAAIAAYHGRAERSDRPVSEIIEESYAWGMGDYLQALVRGYDLPAAERAAVAARLQALTGISADYYLANDLAITKVAFAQELLKDQGLRLGTYDARYVDRIPGPGERLPDPSAKPMQAIQPTMLEHYAQFLNVPWPAEDYRPSAPDTRGWEWNGTLGPGGPFLDFDYPAELDKAFAANPDFRLMIGTGVYDLTTTVGPARYMVTRSAWPRDRVIQREYVGGHMAYTDEATLKAFNDDIRRFVTGAGF